MGIKTVTVTQVTDDLTGESVNETDVFKLPFTFGENSGNVYLTAASLAKINALPEIAALIKAASENGTDKASGNRTSGKSTGIVPGTSASVPTDVRAWAEASGWKNSKGSLPGTGRLSAELIEAFIAANPNKASDTKPANADANTDASAKTAIKTAK